MDQHSPLLPQHHDWMRFSKRITLLAVGTLVLILLWLAIPRPQVKVQSLRVTREGFRLCFTARMPPVFLESCTISTHDHDIVTLAIGKRLKWGSQCLDMHANSVNDDGIGEAVRLVPIKLYGALHASLLRFPIRVNRTFEIEPRKVKKEYEVEQRVERGTESMLVTRVTVRMEHAMPFSVHLDHLAVNVALEENAIGRASVSNLDVIPGEDLAMEAKVVFTPGTVTDELISQLAQRKAVDLRLTGTNDPTMNNLMAALLKPLNLAVKVPPFPEEFVEAILIENPQPTHPIPSNRLQASNPLGVPIFLERIVFLKCTTLDGKMLTEIHDQDLKVVIPAGSEHFVSDPIPTRFEGSLRDAWNIYRQLRRCEEVMVQMTGQVSLLIDQFPVQLAILQTVPMRLMTCNEN